VKTIPIVFTYIADAIVAGAGKSVTSHLPNVTGVYLIGAYEQMPSLIRAYLPNVRIVGGWCGGLLAARHDRGRCCACRRRSPRGGDPQRRPADPTRKPRPTRKRT